MLVSPALMGRCAEDGRMVVFMKRNGRFRARVHGPRSGNVLLRLAQHFRRYADERDLGEADVRRVLTDGEVIESYPDTGRGASYLMLGWSNGAPVHVVAADKDDARLTVVVTAYRPRSELWSDDFRQRT